MYNFSLFYCVGQVFSFVFVRVPFRSPIAAQTQGHLWVTGAVTESSSGHQRCYRASTGRQRCHRSKSPATITNRAWVDGWWVHSCHWHSRMCITRPRPASRRCLSPGLFSSWTQTQRCVLIVMSACRDPRLSSLSCSTNTSPHEPIASRVNCLSDVQGPVLCV